MLEWTEDLSVGVDSIDEDHQAFFRVEPMLEEILASSDSARSMLIESVLNILEEYVEGHFLREQQALAAIDFPGLAVHIKAHDKFAEKVRAIIKDYRQGNLAVVESLGPLISDWITNHIKTMDRQYLGLLTNENVDKRPLVCLLDDPEDDLEF